MAAVTAASHGKKGYGQACAKSWGTLGKENGAARKMRPVLSPLPRSQLALAGLLASFASPA
jgi:hypothetical protein